MRNQKFIRQHVVPAARIFVGDRQVTPSLAVSLAALGSATGQTIRHVTVGRDLHIAARAWMAYVLDEAVLHVERSYVAMAEEVTIAEDIARA